MRYSTCMTTQQQGEQEMWDAIASSHARDDLTPAERMELRTFGLSDGDMADMIAERWASPNYRGLSDGAIARIILQALRDSAERCSWPGCTNAGVAQHTYHDEGAAVDARYCVSHSDMADDGTFNEHEPEGISYVPGLAWDER